MELTRDGQFAKACKALVSQGLADSSDDNIAALRERHPASEQHLDADGLGSVPVGLLPETTVAKISKACQAIEDQYEWEGEQASSSFALRLPTSTLKFKQAIGFT